MTNEECLKAFVSALEKKNPAGRTRIIETKVGSLKEICRALRYYQRKHSDIYAGFCDDTIDAIECLYQESIYQGNKGNLPLWDLFAKPDVVADLSKYLGREQQLPMDVFNLVIEREKHSYSKSVKLLQKLDNDPKRKGEPCKERTWRTVRDFLKKLGHVDMVKHFYWNKEKQTLHTTLPAGKFSVEYKA